MRGQTFKDVELKIIRYVASNCPMNEEDLRLAFPRGHRKLINPVLTVLLYYGLIVMTGESYPYSIYHAGSDTSVPFESTRERLAKRFESVEAKPSTT
jgi:hypothetical protein